MRLRIDLGSRFRWGIGYDTFIFLHFASEGGRFRRSRNKERENGDLIDEDSRLSVQIGPRQPPI
jgi:hypothetical protein